MNHPKTIKKYSGTMPELAEDIGNLDYDAQVELFENLVAKYAKDAIHDKEDLNHPQVAEYLKNISHRLKEILEEEIKPLANLCRSYNEKGIR